MLSNCVMTVEMRIRCQSLHSSSNFRLYPFVSLTYLMSNNGFAQMRGSIEIYPVVPVPVGGEKNATFPGLPFPPPWLLLSPLNGLRGGTTMSDFCRDFSEMSFQKTFSLEPRQLGLHKKKFSNTSLLFLVRDYVTHCFWEKRKHPLYETLVRRNEDG